MSQNDLNIADAPGAAVRADVNSALQALGSTSKGGSRPPTAYAGQLWLDDDTPSATVWTLYLYDGAGDVPLGTVDTVNDVFYPAGVTQTAGNVLCPHKGLAVSQSSNSQVAAAASELVLFNPSGHARRFASFSETLDVTASGANGLDTGSEASSTWYHLWAIGKTDGTLDGLISASATAPT